MKNKNNVPPQLDLTFENPINGYWNGGAKSGGIFTVEAVNWVTYPKPSKHPKEGTDIKFGCWGLNVWFVVKAGKDWKHTAQVAARKLRKLCSIKCHIKVVFPAPKEE